MRAAIITELGGPEVIRVQEIEDPIAGPDEVLVEVKASALNRVDLMQRQGGYIAPPGVRGDVPGQEFAGVVTSVGERVNGLTPGEKVFGLLAGGGNADRVATHELMAIPMPPNLDFAQAAAIPHVFITAYDALFNICDLKMGESVLIHRRRERGRHRCHSTGSPSRSIRVWDGGFGRQAGHGCKAGSGRGDQL